MKSFLAKFALSDDDITVAAVLIMMLAVTVAVGGLVTVRMSSLVVLKSAHRQHCCWNEIKNYLSLSPRIYRWMMMMSLTQRDGIPAQLIPCTARKDDDGIDFSSRIHQLPSCLPRLNLQPPFRKVIKIVVMLG